MHHTMRCRWRLWSGAFLAVLLILAVASPTSGALSANGATGPLYAQRQTDERGGAIRTDSIVAGSGDTVMAEVVTVPGPATATTAPRRSVVTNPPSTRPPAAQAPATGLPRAAASSGGVPVGEPFRPDFSGAVNSEQMVAGGVASAGMTEGGVRHSDGLADGTVGVGGVTVGALGRAAASLGNGFWASGLGAGQLPVRPVEGPPPPPVEVSNAVTAWSYQTRVATPRPFVQAGRAIPGLLTYLQTGMELTMNQTVESPAGPLLLHGTATLTIDWGDGETDVGITNAGGPYPDGQVTHHYPNSGLYDITVTANWIITYNLAGATGVIPLQTVGVLPEFPVTALRAVARPVNE